MEFEPTGIFASRSPSRGGAVGGTCGSPSLARTAQQRVASRRGIILSTAKDTDAEGDNFRRGFQSVARWEAG